MSKTLILATMSAPHPTLRYLPSRTPWLNDLYSYLGAVAIVREKDVDKLVERMGQYYCELVEEYTDSEWTSDISVLMKISSVTSQKLLTFSRSMVYNKFM